MSTAVLAMIALPVAIISFLAIFLLFMINTASYFALSCLFWIPMVIASGFLRMVSRFRIQFVIVSEIECCMNDRVYLQGNTRYWDKTPVIAMELWKARRFSNPFKAFFHSLKQKNRITVGGHMIFDARVKTVLLRNTNGINYYIYPRQSGRNKAI